ncbi:methyltransferase domain-containing protein [Rhizobium ruizarguesonis]|uniref:methyltransferase domain-containing protein n=1 Tax=Rhizobium ruizarguesonis TaxID=2081791 RepID=UPI001FDF0F88|nr:methyltransferase domain-containing protein [Rhizobium ruizarguesonis]
MRSPTGASHEADAPPEPVPQGQHTKTAIPSAHPRHACKSIPVVATPENHGGNPKARGFCSSLLGQFDVAHARFVLEHIPNPLQVVRNMARAVRPGGRVILSDDDYDGLRLWPEPPGFSSVWNAYQRTYDRHCNDPIVGRRLVQLLHQADLRPRRNTLVFFGGCAGDPDFEDVVRNIASIVDEAIDDIVATGLSRDAVTAGLDTLIAWSKAPDSAVWFGMSWAEGIRPP